MIFKRVAELLCRFGNSCRIDKNRFAKLFLPNRHGCLKVFVFVKNSGLNPRLQNGAMIRWHGWRASRNAFRFGSIPSTIHEHVSRLQKLEKENKEVLCHPLPSLTSPAIPYSSFELHLTMEPSPAKKPKQDLCQLSTDDWDVLRKLMGYSFCKVSTTFPPQKCNPRRRKSNRTWDIWHRKTLKPSVKWCLFGKKHLKTKNQTLSAVELKLKNVTEVVRRDPTLRVFVKRIAMSVSLDSIKVIYFYLILAIFIFNS